MAMMIDTMPTTIIRRSTVGSYIFPNVDVWLKRRATYPSTQSVAPSAPRVNPAQKYSSRPNSM